MSKYKPTMPAHVPLSPGTAGKGSVAGPPASTAPVSGQINPAPIAGTAAPGPASGSSMTAGGNQPTPPTPWPGMGARPLGGPDQPSGQPQYAPQGGK